MQREKLKSGENIDVYGYYFAQSYTQPILYTIIKVCINAATS